MYRKVLNSAIYGACVDPQEKQPWREKSNKSVIKTTLLDSLK